MSDKENESLSARLQRAPEDWECVGVANIRHREGWTYRYKDISVSLRQEGKFKTGGYACDVCGTVRGRVRAVLARHIKTGELCQVGSTCANKLWGIGYDNWSKPKRKLKPWEKRVQKRREEEQRREEERDEQSLADFMSSPDIHIKGRADPSIPGEHIRHIEHVLHGAAKSVKLSRETLRDTKGRTIRNTARFLGEIPADLFFADPEFFENPANVKRWLNENHAFRTTKGPL